MKKPFNIILVGVGGQGLITLNNIIAKAAFIEGYDVKTSELHGLSQRGGSVETYIRFGEKVFSPLFAEGEADVVLALETTEALRALRFKNPETVFLVNDNFISYDEKISSDYALENLKEATGKKLYIIKASEICKKELGKEVVSSIYLFGYGIFKKIIPLKEESAIKALEETIPEKHLELNKKAFQLAKA